MSSRQDRLVQLLELWHEAQQNGQPISVEQLCRDQPELADDVRRQLALQRQLDRLAESTVGQAQAASDANGLSPGDTPTAAAGADSGSPPRIPGYEDLTFLGSGGMGRVYKARDTRLDRWVALKVIRPEQLTATALARLNAEARAVAQLDHPHIIKVFEVSEYQPAVGGRPLPYVALEFIPGGSLQKRLGKETLPARESARLVMLLARAIHHAHEKGFVHRDLKPDNVLLAASGDEPSLETALGHPKITDFGLSRRVSDKDRLTEPGTVLGTPAYMAPEQAEGRDDVGPAADVYSLGAILYRLLAGSPPFTGDSAVEVLYRVIRQPAVAIRPLRPDVPAELEAICLRCLAKNPQERYPSATVLAEALAVWLAGTTCVMEQIEQPGASVPAGRRKVLLLAGGTCLAVLTAGGLAGWGWLGGWRRKEASPLPFKGYIDLVMSRPKDKLRQRKRLDNPASRPLLVGDQVRIEVKLNRPGYLYVLWIDTKGEVGLVYPWIEDDPKRRQPEEARPELRLPEHPEGFYRVVAGPPGMETLLLLVREMPLPEEMNPKKVLAGLGSQGRANEEDLEEVAWFENGRLVRDEDLRGANLKEVGGSPNPVLRLQRVLHERLEGLCEYTRAVTFGNKGGPERR